MGDCISHTAFMDGLESGGNVADFPGTSLDGFHPWREKSDSTGFISTSVANMRSISFDLIEPSITRI